MQYTGLARFYDTLQAEVDYEKWADYIEKILGKYGKNSEIVLELACGTGSLSKVLAQRNYDLICVDNSEDMLAVAKNKCEGEGNSPLFLCQDMAQLDLYGTIDVAICCLDSVNYLTYLADVKRAFGRVSLFMNQGGLFIFDVKTRALFREMKGQANGISQEDSFFFWQYDYDEKSGICQHNVEMFEGVEGQYRRYTETHFQRAYSFEQLEKLLVKSGFQVVGKFQPFTLKAAVQEQGRVFFVARKV